MIPRQPEPEFMDVQAEADVYALADFAEVNAAFVERLLDVAALVTARTVTALDLGTGPGDIPIRVLRARPQWRLVAEDAAYAMLQWGKQSEDDGGPTPRWVQADAKYLPFESRRFEIVFSNSILHHITEVDLLWGEVKRVAKPGAAVFLRDLARPDTAEDARAIVSRYAGNEPDLLQSEFLRSLLSAYTPEEVRAQLDSAGLEFIEVAKVTDRHLDIFGVIR